MTMTLDPAGTLRFTHCMVCTCAELVVSEATLTSAAGPNVPAPLMPRFIWATFVVMLQNCEETATLIVHPFAPAEGRHGIATGAKALTAVE